jgi:hypothetical protein
MSNICQILLSRQEFKLANVLTAYYELSLTEERVIQAIFDKNFDWLSWVWSFEKNFIGPRRNKNSAKKITLKNLFNLITSTPETN